MDEQKLPEDMQRQADAEAQAKAEAQVQIRDEITLKEHVINILGRKSDLRAKDIVKELAKAGVNTNKAAVNKVLYSGPFERAGPSTTSKAPTWCPRLRTIPDHDTFELQVVGIGTFHILNSLPADKLEPLLNGIAAAVPEGIDLELKFSKDAPSKNAEELAMRLGYHN